MTNLHFRTHLLMDSRNSDNTIFGGHHFDKRKRKSSVTRRGNAKNKVPDVTLEANNPMLQTSSETYNRFPYKTQIARGLYPTVTTFDKQLSSLGAKKVADSELAEQVTQDCFIVPIHCAQRFMPNQVFHLSSKTLSMMQLENPSVSIVLDFLETLRPLSPPIPTMVQGPHPLNVQLDALKETLKKVNQVGSALEGMMLMNIEKNATYPLILYMVINTTITDPNKFLMQYNSIMVENFSPEKIQHVAVYEEVATIARPPIDILPKKPNNSKTGYIITVFKVFPGDDKEKLEQSWLTWTGARMTYKYLPKMLGLKRITFHKKLWPNGGITYVLLCECSSLMDYVTEGCGFVEQLRARCCGYTGLYRIIDHF
uniref:DUF7153 domain-containing protein n=1 Tax=Strigamia maritima TaxID=126957 RepID=T1JCK5_STRMM